MVLPVLDLLKDSAGNTDSFLLTVHAQNRLGIALLCFALGDPIGALSRDSSAEFPDTFANYTINLGKLTGAEDKQYHEQC